MNENTVEGIAPVVAIGIAAVGWCLYTPGFIYVLPLVLVAFSAWFLLDRRSKQPAASERDNRRAGVAHTCVSIFGFFVLAAAAALTAHDAASGLSNPWLTVPLSILSTVLLVPASVLGGLMLFLLLVFVVKGFGHYVINRSKTAD